MFFQSKRSHFLSFETKIILISHSIFWLAAHLLIPSASVFYITQLSGVTLTEVGIASLIFFLSFGLLDPVVGMISDHIEGLRDEVSFIIFGYLARGVLFMLFALATHVWHLYMFQFFAGALRALASPADKALFTKYLKSRKTATLWGMDESLVNISSALGAGVGGYLISIYGFRTIFVFTGMLTIVAGMVNIPLLKRVRGGRVE